MTRALIPGGAHCASPRAPSSELDHGRGRHCTGRALRVWRAPQRIVRLMQSHFTPSESTFSYFEAMRAYLERHGKPQAVYSDKASIFRVNQNTRLGAPLAVATHQFVYKRENSPFNLFAQ